MDKNPRVTAFLDKAKAVHYVEPVTKKSITPCYIDEEQQVARWVIYNQAQRLRKFPAIAKDATIYERLIQPFCTTIEVLDLTDLTQYTISKDNFDEYKYLRNLGAGEQYLVDRKYWHMKTLYE